MFGPSVLNLSGTFASSWMSHLKFIRDFWSFNTTYLGVVPNCNQLCLPVHLAQIEDETSSGNLLIQEIPVP
jgi:hypothetical protein